MLSGIKFVFQRILRSIGIDAYLRKTGYHYVWDYYGKSAHKQRDVRKQPVFGELAGAVVDNKRSSLYYDRLYTIYQILESLGFSAQKGDEIKMVEVGIYKGGTSYFIASLAERLGLRYSHYCFDTFEGHKAEDINKSVETDHTSGLFSDTSFESVQQYLQKFKSVQVYKGRFQDRCDALKDMRFNFVHLDMDIYDPTIFALDYFDSRMVKGGAILMDDYGFNSCPGIEKAVHEFTETHTDYFGMALLTGQYLFVKL